MNPETRFEEALTLAKTLHTVLEPIAEEIVSNVESMTSLSAAERKSLKSYIIVEGAKGILGL